MIILIANLLVNTLGMDFNKALRFAKWLFIGLVALIILFVGIFVYRACKPQVKIDEEKISKINKANEKERREELKVIVTENADVIKTNDNRTLETEQSIEAREKLIDEKVKEVDAKINEIRQQKGDVSQEELICLLQPETCQ